MSKKRIPVWLLLIVLGIGGLVAAVIGLFVYVSLTAVPIHPIPGDVPSTTSEAGGAKWAAAVEQARQILRAGVAEQNLPGLSVAVGVGGEIVWAEGFGWADLQLRGTVTPDTKFRIQATSISFTSILAGLLIQEGRLNPDAEIQTYVPSFPKKQWPVTLRQLMGHIAGIRSDDGDEEQLSERCELTVDALRRFSGAALRFEPGTRFQFSTYGWILVSAAIEAAAGEQFFNLMRSRVLEPLGLKDTTVDSDATPPVGRAVFYYPRFAANTRYGPESVRPGDYSCFAGAGAYLSTPSELVRFGIAVNQGKLLQPEVLKLLQTSQTLRSGEQTGYGLGWDLDSVSVAGQTMTSIGHDGEYAMGGTTTFRTFPNGVVIAITTNISFADTNALALKIAEVFLKKSG